MTKRQMFLRLLTQPTLVRRGRTLTALLAVVVAASVATATLNLYTDVQAKLHKEFRSYGANVVVTARDGQSLPSDALSRIDSLLAGHGMAVPYSYVVAKTSDGTPIVAAGVDFERVRRLNNWWSVTAWPSGSGQGLVGVRALAALSSRDKNFKLIFNNHPVNFAATGILKTGSGEDSRVYLALDEFVAWSGVPTSTIEIAVTGSTVEISQMIAKIAEAVPGAKVEPVRQIVEAEGRVLNKTRLALLASTLLIVLTAALCMLATLTASVLDRRKDFAVMKALGASERTVNAVFAAEAATLGALGAVLGFLAGLGIAFLIGRLNFNAAVSPRFAIFPAVLLGSVLVSLGSALVPLALLKRVQPATILRGE
ncbi:MAG: ABC transporter permease [Acidobacteriia bacterium]|nr:ABC transporter permease [Terriglobia bacterium]